MFCLVEFLTCLFQSRIMSNKTLFCFPCLILRLGEARVSLTNKKLEKTFGGTELEDGVK